MDERKLKRCSTSSTHAEAADDPMQKERELNDLETEVNIRKKQKQEEETTEKKKECCYDTKDAEGNNERTIFVTGFDTSGSRDEIRSALAKHFSSCGELTRVFVPIECETGVSIGYAFINLKRRAGDIEAALSLNESDLGGRKLLVTMATKREEYYIHINFKGCEICLAMFAAKRRERYRWKAQPRNGRVAILSPETEKWLRQIRKIPKIRKIRKMAKSKTKEG
ncbi:unnamed protein product [Eruca vesicaria subsp. sativa]|uniref:RRM domain-containing protein n=1 Tax=Eruca vesicaria subsp. sativa TaxID=29727 RepID=A0ABC8KNQ9_ERUVS|nr:unnamed protein product [Eruca vesicaria subsp. sativa]